MKPDFKFLEWLMEDCWQDDPDHRKVASEILDIMVKPSFLCLKNVEELPDIQDACFAVPDEKVCVRCIFRYEEKCTVMG